MSTTEYDWKGMDEDTLRDCTVPTPDTLEELFAIVEALAERQHDYGTCVYAMSISATAAFNFISRKLGVTGFQASCADMNIICRTRNLKRGRLLNFEDLLFPQYADKFPGWSELLEEHREWLAEEAAKKLEENPDPHPNVLEHWQRLVKRGVSA